MIVLRSAFSLMIILCMIYASQYQRQELLFTRRKFFLMRTSIAFLKEKRYFHNIETYQILRKVILVARRIVTNENYCRFSLTKIGRNMQFLSAIDRLERVAKKGPFSGPCLLGGCGGYSKAC